MDIVASGGVIFNIVYIWYYIHLAIYTDIRVT